MCSIAKSSDKPINWYTAVQSRKVTRRGLTIYLNIGYLPLFTTVYFFCVVIF